MLLLHSALNAKEQCHGLFTQDYQLQILQESFAKNHDYTGKSFVPPNMKAQLYVSVRENLIYKKEFSHLRLSEQSKRLRSFLNKLRRESRPNQHNEREMAAFIVFYSDGSSKAIRFTSNDLVIRPEHANSALNESGILSPSNKEVVRIIDIHTHPDPSNSAIQKRLNEITDHQMKEYQIKPSIKDFEQYKNFLKLIEQNLGKNVDLQAYVLPTCKNCRDLVFHITKEQILTSGAIHKKP